MYANLTQQQAVIVRWSNVTVGTWKLSTYGCILEITIRATHRLGHQDHHILVYRCLLVATVMAVVSVRQSVSYSRCQMG